ncbi:hypothetical protein [Fructobacillus fructosus]|nr:hypothetical protein [Fructobacillus fructosus]MBC9118617.1 hypothetical protein [Fructobacillus fructosus]MBD9365094.1 hypothetical protein [Leuconostoc mesenteroides]
MINFGVNIGEELSGPHFGIVINAKDSKHVGKITVLPLTSKFHKGHVRLGKNIVEETLRLISEKKKELDLAFQHMDNVLNESDILLTKFIAEYEVKSNEFSLDSLKVIQQAFQKAEKSVNFLPNRDIPLNQKIEFLRIFLLNVQPGSKDKQDLYALYTEMLVVVEKIEESKESLDLLEYKKHGLEHLYNQLQKYNNESFADIKNMTTISKTRVKKLSEYDISGNVSISNESLQKIKNSIHSFLNI